MIVDGLLQLVLSPFVIGWRRIRARLSTPATVQASLADDMRSMGLLANAPYDAMYDRLAQDIIRNLRHHPSVGHWQAAEQLFILLDSLGLQESSDEVTQSVVDLIVWRVNSRNLR